MGDTNGQVVAGGNGQGSELNQLYWPRNVLVDNESDSLIICDQGNQRIVRWSRRRGTNKGEILLGNISSFGLAMDDQRCLYVTDNIKHEVRQYRMGYKNGIVVAGGNGQGSGFNELNFPTCIFVNRATERLRVRKVTIIVS